LSNIPTDLHHLEEPFWCPVYVLSPDKAWNFTLQGFNINFTSAVHASNLFSCAYSRSDHIQQFADTLNPDNRYVFLLISFSVSVTVGLLFKPDENAWGR
jgi:hypothetical protein